MGEDYAAYRNHAYRVANLCMALQPDGAALDRIALAAAFLIALGFGLVAPVLPQFATTFGVGNTEASVIVAIFAFMRLVFAPAGGALIGRLGERPANVAFVVRSLFAES